MSLQRQYTCLSLTEDVLSLQLRIDKAFYISVSKLTSSVFFFKRGLK